MNEGHSRTLIGRKWTMALDMHLADRVYTKQSDGTPGHRSRRILRGYRGPNGLFVKERYVGAVWMALLFGIEDISASPVQTTVSYERIAQSLCIQYRDVSDAVTLLTSFGFVQKKHCYKMTNVTRLFQHPHLPLEEWTEFPDYTVLNLEDVEEDEEELRERSRKPRVSKGGSESKPSRKQTANKVSTAINDVMAALESQLTNHPDFSQPDGRAWLRRSVIRCSDMAQDATVMRDIFRNVLLSETVEGQAVLDDLFAAKHIGVRLVELFPRWLEQHQAQVDAPDALDAPDVLDALVTQAVSRFDDYDDSEYSL